MIANITNDNSKRLIAAILVFAMIVCAFAVVSFDSVEAAEGDDIVTVEGESYGTDLSNESIGNIITATGNDDGVSISGDLGNINIDPEADDGVEKAFYDSWNGNTEYTHAIVYTLNVDNGKYVTFTGSDGNVKSVAADAEGLTILQYVKDATGSASFYITNGVQETIPATYEKRIVVEWNVTLNTSTNYDNGYVAVPNSNALAGSVTKGPGWELSEGTLTLTDYNGVEYFDGSFTKVVLAGTNNTITLSPEITANDGAKDTFGAIKTTGALEISGTSLTINMDVNGVTVDGTMNNDKVAAIYGTNTITITCANLNIDITGVVTEDTAANVNYSEAVYAIYNSGSANVMIGAESNPVKLDITVSEDEPLSFAIAYGTQTYNNVTGEITAGNRGIQIGGTTLSFVSSNLTITGGEKAIQAKTSGVSVSLTKSNITLQLGDAMLNPGDNDRFGMKLNGTLTVDAESKLTTDGLRIMTDTITSPVGPVVINGDYAQNPNAEMNVIMSGFYVDGVTTAINATRDAVPTTNAAGFYLTDDAEVYGNVNVKNSTGTVVEKAVSSVTDANAALSDTTSQVVTFIVSSSTSADTIDSIPESKIFNIDATVNPISNLTLDLNGSKVVLTNVSGYLTVSEGSVVIDGDRIAGTIENVDGTVRISGDVAAGETLTFVAAEGAETARVIIEGALDINGTINFSGVEVVVTDEGTMTVGNGAYVNLTDSAELSVSGKVLGTTGTIYADEGTTVYATSGAILAPVLTGEGDYYIDDAMDEYRISKNVVSNITTTAQQKVYIDNSITIFSGFTVNIAGSLEVAEGMRVIIEDGAQLIVNGINSTADISGDIIVRGANGFQFTGKTMTVDGSISVNSDSTTPALDVNGKTELNGTITVQKNAAASFDQINVNAEATLTVNGTASGDVNNYGTVVMNGTASGFNVSMQNGGTVNVASVTGTMTVTDLGMTLRKGVTVDDPNSVSFSNITGVTVTSSIDSRTDDNGQRVYFSVMTLSGTAGPVRNATSTNVGITDGTVTVSDTFTVGKVDVTIASGATLKVTGTVTAVSEVGDWSISGAGTLDVTGLVRTNEAIHETGGVANVNAVYYELIENSVPYHYYTNLADALATDVDELTVLGNITILENTVIPDGKNITANDIQVGDNDHTDVTLTVENGAFLDAGVITVIGTMEVENDDDLDATRVISDVSSEIEENYITSTTYTNIYNALAQAQSGETVRITSVSGTVYLTRDVTIPAGVTLEVPTQKTLSVVEGVTLTVDGTLYLNNGDLTASEYQNGAYVAGEFGTVASVTVGNVTTNKAVVTVTGMIQTNGDFEYSEYYVSGAYYDIMNYTYVTTVEKAVAVIDDVDAMTIDVYGENTVGDIQITGTEDEEAIVNIHYYSNGKSGSEKIVAGEFTADTVTLSYSRINVDNGVVLNGTFANAVGSIDIVNMVSGTAVTDSTMSSAVVFADGYTAVNGEDVRIFTVSGTLKGITSEGVDSASVTFNDAVTINSTLTIDPVYQPITGTDKKVGTVTVSGELIVTGNNVRLDVKGTGVASEVTIDGTMTAINGGQITMENAVVNGTLNEAVKTDTTTVGSISVGTLYVGLTSEDITLGAAGAVVSGDVSVTNTMYVLDGCTVDEQIIDGIKYTQFYVENTLWMTAYAFGTSTVTVTDCPAENALLVGWLDEDGKRVASFDDNDDKNNSITVSNNSVYADLEYDIYRITVFADPGISAVYIDGKLMTEGYYQNPITGQWTNGFMLYVSAGNHEVTYKLGNYFSGEAQMTVNGAAVSGNTFTTSGTGAENQIVTIYLQGIEASAPETPTTGGSSDDGMGLTDYLLIILVILIVVMAIIVALRLMRS